REAFQRAGIDTSSMSLDEKRSWGVILGSGGGAPDFTEEQYRLYFSDELRKVSAYNVSSSTMGTISSEVSLRFDLRGPSHMASTGHVRCRPVCGNFQTGDRVYRPPWHFDAAQR